MPIKGHHGSKLEPTDGPLGSDGLSGASRGNNTTGYALSQPDDYLHSGDHSLVKDMNLYVYSTWVYRA